MNNFEFNGDVSRWDVSNVINMESMFQSAYKFNSSLQTWDTSNVENFKQMFMNAKSFNKNINYFNISKGENLSYMLAGATSFNNGSAKGKTNNPLTLVPKKNRNYWYSDNADITGMFKHATNMSQDISLILDHWYRDPLPEGELKLIYFKEQIT